jgi:hypothetical protein
MTLLSDMFACAVVLACACAVQPTREVVRPANQLPLNEAELREEVAKMLTANNPAAPQNLARFNMKERSYKFEPMVEQHVSAGQTYTCTQTGLRKPCWQQQQRANEI